MGCRTGNQLWDGSLSSIPKCVGSTAHLAGDNPALLPSIGNYLRDEEKVAAYGIDPTLHCLY